MCNYIRSCFNKGAAVWCCALALATIAHAVTATDTFTARITIESDCSIVSTEVLDFGTAGVLDANMDASADITIQCADTTPYEIELNEGTTASATTTTRLMKRTSGTETVEYQMFQNAARTVNWGEIADSEQKSATGNGTLQTHTVYGRVPAQDTPRPGNYEDTITVTLTY